MTTTYTCAACGDLFQFTFKNPWYMHACAYCGDYIAKMLGEERGNPGLPMGLKDASERYAAAVYMHAAGFRPPKVVREPEAMCIVFCNKCGCHYSGTCPTHLDVSTRAYAGRPMP